MHKSGELAYVTDPVYSYLQPLPQGECFRSEGVSLGFSYFLSVIQVLPPDTIPGTGICRYNYQLPAPSYQILLLALCMIHASTCTGPDLHYF